MLSGHSDVRRKLTWTNKATVLLEGVGSGCMPAKGSEQARLVERKVCFVQLSGRAEVCPKADSTLRQAGGESVRRLRRGPPCRDSTVSSDGHFQISHRWFCHLLCFQHSLQFQGSFVSMFLRPVLGTVAAYVVAPSW